MTSEAQGEWLEDEEGVYRTFVVDGETHRVDMSASIANALTQAKAQAEQEVGRLRGLVDDLENSESQQADLHNEQRQRAEAAERQSHPEIAHRCADCGGPHVVDTSLTPETWKQIAEPYESLCTLCIDKRLVAKGLKAEAKFYYAGEALTGKLYDGDYSDEIRDWAQQAHKHAEAAAAEHQRAEAAEAELTTLRAKAELADDAQPFMRDVADGVTVSRDAASSWCDDYDAIDGKEAG